MSTFYYNAESEGIRRAILQSSAPTIGLPDGVFVVRADDGETFYLDTSIFTRSATIVVRSEDCRPGASLYTILVTNHKDKSLRAKVGGWLDDKATSTPLEKGAEKMGAAAGRAIGKLMGNAARGAAVGSNVVSTMIEVLSADSTGMGAAAYHTRREIRSSGGRTATLLISGEKPPWRPRSARP
ncbi:MAG: hypothetical protein BGO49_08720 [Planctomycetales bacterium 71-10]|nr:MAG: hypothetical protein BGO49_08720 [Planctomycetales bacterium 71-10]